MCGKTRQDKLSSLIEMLQFAKNGKNHILEMHTETKLRESHVLMSLF